MGRAALGLARIRQTCFCLALFLGATFGGENFGRAFDGSFESPQATWQVVESDCRFRTTAHERKLGEAHTGKGCEYFRFTASHGTFLYVAQKIPPATVIQELAASVWVKSERAGIQLLVRAVLPRSLEESTGRPFTVLLAGDSYTKLEHWQQLKISDANQLLERQVRLLRARYGSEIDAREAFIDLVVLNAYGGVGVTSLWIDDLELHGEVAAAAAAKWAASDEGSPQGSSKTGNGPLAQGVRLAQFEELPPEAVSAEPARRREGAQRVGSLLYADGRPFFPVAIEENGEGLEFLKSLGCNTVRLKQPATEAQLREAARLELWLVSPPLSPAAGGAFATGMEGILAWDLGSADTSDRLELLGQTAAQARRSDTQTDRMLLGETRDLLSACSREADIVLQRRAVWGASYSLAEIRQSLWRAQAVMRPGTPLWAAVPTEPGSELVTQWLAWGMPETAPVPIEPDQIRAATYAAVLGKARGICFTSRSRLDRETGESPSRAEAIELVARELEVLSPWLAGGGAVTPVTTSDARYLAATLHHDRGDLLIVLSAAAGQQFAVTPADGARVSCVLPALSEAAQAYRVLDGGVQPLRPTRVAGGVRLELPEPGLVSLVLLTQDAAVLHGFSRRLAESALRRAGLEHNLLAVRIPLVANIDAAAPSPALASPTRGWIDDALTSSEQAQRLLTAGDARGAARFCARSNQSLARVERYHWEQAARGFTQLGASPCLASFWSLPLHWQAAERLNQARPGTNLVADGNFENLAALVAAGWLRSDSLPGEGTTAVELSPEEPREGSYCLRLASTGPATADERPAVWVATPQLPARVGSIFRIHGWARILPAAGNAAASDTSLVVYDSWMGPEYGVRLRGPQWQEFTLYRAAPRSETAQVVAALQGRGEARLDGLTITPLFPPGGTLTDETPPLTFGPPPLEAPRRN